MRKIRYAKSKFNPHNPKDGSTICQHADLCQYMRCALNGACKCHEPQERIPISYDKDGRPVRHW